MIVSVTNGGISGRLTAIPSKSSLHRLLIFTALSDKMTFITCEETEAEDIRATIACLTALGAEVKREKSGFAVTPIDRSRLATGSQETVVLPCLESGSTLRFLLPVACALGLRCAFEMKGRLPQRPLAPMDEQLRRNGINLSHEGEILRCEGVLPPGDYHISGNISSQYVTGLLMALPLLDGKSSLTVSEPIESSDYIAMTLEAAAYFGVKPSITVTVSQHETRYDIEGNASYKSPLSVASEGDWSNAAFWLCAGAMPGGYVTVSGLKKDSAQGDKDICRILSQMGAELSWEGENIRVKEGERNGMEIDVGAIPDLAPVLAAVAAAGTGKTVIRNAARLRLKESDRLFSTAQVLNSLGADVKEAEDALFINGRRALKGGEVDSSGDHRIAMMAAIASAACEEPVIINGAQAVNKSYPAFWDDLASLGKTVKIKA